MAREFFCAYHSLIQSLTPYGDAECGRLFRAALVYSADGREEEFRGNERYIWPTIRQMIDRDKAAYEQKCRTNRENAVKANGTDRPRTLPNGPQEEEEDKEEDKEEDEDKDEEEEEENAPLPRGGKRPRARFTPPTLEEVAAYVREKGYRFDPEFFFSYYDSQDWKKANGQKVSNWKRCCVTWEQREPAAEIDRRSNGKTMDQLRRLREKMTAPRDDSTALAQMDRLMAKMEAGNDSE